jgi:hypothetical protein
MTAQIVLTAVAIIALAFLLGALSGRFRFMLLLLAYALVLAVASGLSIASSYPDGLAPLPYLTGSDGEGYYEDALKLADLGVQNFQDIITTNYAGYQIYLALWFDALGPSLGVALFANHLLLMLSVLCLFRATELLTGSQQAALLACVAMMLTGSHIFHALLILKEPAINLAFSFLLLAVALALKRRGAAAGLPALLLFVAAVLILVGMRATLLLFVLVLLGWLATLFARQRSWVLVALGGVLALMVPLADTFSRYTFDSEFFARTMLLNTVLSQTLEAGEVDAGGVVGRVSSAYLALPFVLRMLLFFVPTLLQMLLPFDVWSTAFIDDHFSMFFSRNANLVWLLFGAAWTLYAVVHVRRLADPVLARLVLAGATFYVIVAVIYGGAIPRYGAPALYFIYPAIGLWWHQLREQPAVRRHVQRFFRWYFGALLALMLPYLVLNLLRAV